MSRYRPLSSYSLYGLLRGFAFRIVVTVRGIAFLRSAPDTPSACPQKYPNIPHGCKRSPPDGSGRAFAVYRGKKRGGTAVSGDYWLLLWCPGQAPHRGAQRTQTGGRRTGFLA